MDDETLLREFEACTLPFDQWTHRAHVRVAYLYLSRCPFPEALTRMRARIKAYNGANHVPEGPDRGYHETMTHAWMWLIELLIREYGPYGDSNAFFDDHPQLATRQVLRFFYSRRRFLSPEAKQQFVEPDLAPCREVHGNPLLMVHDQCRRGSTGGKHACDEDRTIDLRAGAASVQT